MLGFDRSAMVIQSSFPQRSRQFVDVFSKPTSTRRSSLLLLCAGRSDRLEGAVRPGSPVRRPMNTRPGGTRQGKRTLGCPRLSRPARTSSHAAEVVEEENMRLEK
jgi:hypothetical protein